MKAPWKFSTKADDDNALGKRVGEFYAQHEQRFDHKFSNLIAKMTTETAMTQILATTEKPHVNLADQLAPSECFEFDTLGRPWLWTSKPLSWTWDFLSFPFAGLAQIWQAVKGKMFVMALKLDELKDLAAISSLDTFLDSESWKEACEKAEKDKGKGNQGRFVASMEAGECVLVPFDYLPVVIGFGGEEDDAEENVRAIVHVLGTNTCLSNCDEKGKTSIKTFLESEMSRHSDKKIFATLKPEVKKWTDTWA